MSIESKIDRLSAALEKLTEVLASAAIQPQDAGNTADVGTGKTAGKREEAPEQTAAPEQTEAPTPTSKYADAANSSLDDIRSRLAKVVEAHGTAPVQKALNSIGVAMLSEVPQARYPELLTTVSEEIGGEV